MSEKNNLNQEQLKSVTGGKSSEAGFYIDIAYVTLGGRGNYYHDGPFESLQIANKKLEEKKKELIEDGCTIKSAIVVHVE